MELLLSVLQLVDSFDSCIDYECFCIHNQYINDLNINRL